MQKTIVSGVACWSRWQPDRNLYFNAWFVEGSGGNIVVDPLDMDDAVQAYVAERGLAAVVVTNRDHERSAAAFAERFKVPVCAPQADAPEMTVKVDRPYDDGDDVFGWRAVRFDGMKSAGESALFRASDRTAITGDAFWGAPAGALTLMADDKLANPEKAALSTRRLLALNVRHLLVGDGAPVFDRAWEALVAMLEARSGLLFRRVNVDELEWIARKVPAPFAAGRAEISWFLGVRKLGYAATRLEPGQTSSPFHGHTCEEELLLVVDGEPSVRMPSGKFKLRKGDLVALPVGPVGAHRLYNETAQPATVLFFANVAEGDGAFYPDTKKVLADRYGLSLLVRDNPELGYFEGEV